MAEETARRNAAAQSAATGNVAGAVAVALDDAGLGYQSPLRAKAVAAGNADMEGFNQAINHTRGALEGAIRSAPRPQPGGSGAATMLGLGAWNPYGSLKAANGPPGSLNPHDANACP